MPLSTHRRYDFAVIERKWQAYWSTHRSFRAEQRSTRPSFYVLDMFPYPSGAGLHVGHPLGYVATDIIARYYWSKKYNVLHPMGFDDFGLPAEQYAIETGLHPAKTTAKNVARYKEQLLHLGLSFDWEREVQTSSPSYYRWTQWIFLQMFESWYDKKVQKARPIADLVAIMAREGNSSLYAACDEDTPILTAASWENMSPLEQQAFLGHYRLAYRAKAMVNWCPKLGTVLANEEVKEGLSERGGHPVVRRKMPQWFLRTTAYAERLLEDLEALEWPKAIKESQRHWIGRSEGISIKFEIVEETNATIKVFTTRADTIFGVSFLALAPEHPFIEKLASKDPSFAKQVATLVCKGASPSHKMDSNGLFTHYHAHHPLTDKQLPIWVTNYVLASYGDGVVMGVPAHDARDHAFATRFGLSILPVIVPPQGAKTTLPYEEKNGSLIASAFLNGMVVHKASEAVMRKLEAKGIGKRKISYKLHDATFSRQRYWGEPIPIYYREGVPYALPKEELPLQLPTIGNYRPTASGEPPLARAEGWKTKEGYPIEQTTMPGWAGSSWYFWRYMDPKCTTGMVSKEACNYWDSVDFYIGGAEHATGHLLYARFYTKFLYDRGYLSLQEPFKKLINQGMVQSVSHFSYRIKGTQRFVSHGLKDAYETSPIYVDSHLIKDMGQHTLDREAFVKWRPDLADAAFILEGGAYICGHQVEKMSKSKYNTVTPDQVIQDYGADTLRMYLMFLGPIGQSKLWDTKGIEGVFRFIHKVWSLFYDRQGHVHVVEEEGEEEEKRVMARTVQQVEDSIGRFAFNTAISGLMIGANHLVARRCYKRALLVDFVRILAPFAPHLAEELWQEALGHQESVIHGGWPSYDSALLLEKVVTYPLAINGKKRALLTLPITMDAKGVEKQALAHPSLPRWIAKKKIKRVIVVPKKMINIVIG